MSDHGATADPDLTEAFLTVGDLQRLLRCSRRFAYQAAHQIGIIRLGRVIRLDPRAVRAWLAGVR